MRAPSVGGAAVDLGSRWGSGVLLGRPADQPSSTSLTQWVPR
ncbi:hypothetical protein [Streptomyces sp. WAC05292]|nr:hypothetical protein [Streptomyces sp. WAC05292]